MRGGSEVWHGELAAADRPTGSALADPWFGSTARDALPRAAVRPVTRPDRRARSPKPAAPPVGRVRVDA